MRVIIAGSRNFDNYQLLKEKCEKIIANLNADDIVIISGTSRGADRLGERFAAEQGYKTVLFPAQWQSLGKKAGPIRNRDVAKYAAENNQGILIAFWDGQSRGTQNMIKNAKQYNLNIKIIRY